MANLIFVSGLYHRNGDLSVLQQAETLKKGFGPTADLISFPHDEKLQKITDAINQNQAAKIVLFSAGCKYSRDIASYLRKNSIALTNLHINEPYTISEGTFNNVTAAINLGVPRSNVYNGGTEETGSNITGSTKLKGRKSHFQSLEPLGQLLSGIAPEPQEEAQKLANEISINERADGDRSSKIPYVAGYWELKVLSENPYKSVLKGNFNTLKAPGGGGGDALRAFESRPKDKFGGRMNTTTNKVLEDLYKAGKNPKIQSIKVDMTSKVVNWEVTIVESDDGKAYVGLTSRGGSGGTFKTQAKSQIDEKKKNLASEVGEANVDILDVFDYVNEPRSIRQIFIQYTKPTKFPPLNKAQPNPPATGTGASGPQGSTGPQGNTPPAADTGASGPQGDTPQQTDEQDQGRSERTGEDPNKDAQKPKDFQNTKTLKTIFPNQKKAVEIKFDLPPRTAYQAEYIEGLGYLPFLWYNVYQIEYEHILSLQLTYSENIPILQVKFRDSLGKMKDDGIPLDDSRISLYLNPRSKMLKPIHLDFKIVEFSENLGNYEILGALDVKELYLKKFKSYSKKTSYELFSQIAKDTGLGFASNVDNTEDRMTWINSGNRLIYFMNETSKFAYKSDETYLTTYIDFYYQLCYIDVEKEMKRDIQNELGLVNTGMEDIVKDENKEKIQKNFLTNDFAAKSTNFYFEKYTIINDSTSKSLRKGYKTKLKYYDELIKHFIEFDVDPITSEADLKILLRGAPQDDVFFKEHVNFHYAGRIDEDNMHKNFHYAPVQNKINFTELSKISIMVELPTPNFNFYKYQKIYLILSNQKDTFSKSHLNPRLTGQWLIVDISYNYTGFKLRQNITLVRRDLDLTPEELAQEKNQPPQNKPNQDQKQNEPNPTDQEPPVAGEQAPVVGATPSTPPAGNTGPEPPVDEDFPLTKEMWRAIYNGKINPKVMERYYEPTVKVLKKNNIKDFNTISKVLAYINIESNYLAFVEEDINWFKYYKNP
jgi:hypothetical protein